MIYYICTKHLQGVCVCWCVCSSSPVHWHVWTRPSCRPGSRCLCSAAPDPSVCSRSAGSGPRCRPPTPAARAGGGTRRWPSRPPGGHCTAARGASWSCSTPITVQRQTEALSAFTFTLKDHSSWSQGATWENPWWKLSSKFSNLIVVASGREVLVVRWPFEATNFLPVTLQPPLSRGGGPDVPLEDHSVPTTRRQLLPVPCQGTLGTKGGRVLHFSGAIKYPSGIACTPHSTCSLVQYICSTGWNLIFENHSWIQISLKLCLDNFIFLFFLYCWMLTQSHCHQKCVIVFYSSNDWPTRAEWPSRLVSFLPPAASQIWT